MVSWLLTSLVLSVVLTVVLNVALRAGPRGRRPHRVDRWAGPSPWSGTRPGRPLPPPDPRTAGLRLSARPRVRVFFPWRFMLVASLLLTLLLNVLPRLGR